MSDHDKILEIIRLKDQVPIALDPRKTALLVIVEDACTAFSEDLHRAAVQAFSLAFGRVRKTEEVMRLLSQASSL